MENEVKVDMTAPPEVVELETESFDTIVGKDAQRRHDHVLVFA